MKKIFAFAGRKRSGKGLLSLGLKEKMDNVVILTIANYLKELCCNILGVDDISTLNEWKDNGHIFEYIPNDRWFNLINKSSGIPIDTIKKEIGDILFTDVRQMLQVIGTDLIRKYCPNWHVDKLTEDINSYSDDYVIVIDDVRFKNEKEAIEKLGGEVFFMVRPNWYDVSNHISEISLKWQDFDDSHVIINDLPKEEIINLFYYSISDIVKQDEVEIFLSANSIYKEVYNCNFPSIGTNKEIINELIKQNKDKHHFINNGIIHFTAKNRKIAEEFNDNVFNYNHDCWRKQFIIYNPLIDENLKRFF